MIAMPTDGWIAWWRATSAHEWEARARGVTEREALLAQFALRLDGDWLVLQAHQRPDVRVGLAIPGHKKRPWR